MSININEYKRFEKQITLKKIGISGQKKIFNAKVLIIGVGGLGCPVLTYLAASGVGTIGIVDFDKVEISNLNRQTLFTIKDVGKLKVNQAKEKIIKINKKINIKIYNKKVNLNNIKSLLKNFDIICDGTDNFETRYIINDHCKRMKKILVSAAISKFEGHLFKFNFKKKGSCFRCFMPEKPLIQNNCQSEGIFAPVAGVLGSLQASEALKTILDLKHSFKNEMIIFDSINTKFRNVRLIQNPKCKNRC